MSELQKSVRKYLSAIGRKGGSATSARKAAAVRENGKRGGHPSKFKASPELDATNPPSGSQGAMDAAQVSRETLATKAD